MSHGSEDEELEEGLHDGELVPGTRRGHGEVTPGDLRPRVEFDREVARFEGVDLGRGRVRGGADDLDGAVDVVGGLEEVRPVLGEGVIDPALQKERYRVLS